MKKFILLLFVVCLSLPGYSKLKNKDVTGKWTYYVDAGGEVYEGTFKIGIEEGKLAGKLTSNDGNTLPFKTVEIKENNILYIELPIDYETIKMNLKIEGDKYEGSVSNYEGEAPITGKKLE